MKKLFTPVFFFFTLLLTAQNPFSFTNSNAKFTSAVFHSGNCVSVVDMNGDGMDDLARLSQGNDVYYTIQRTNQTFNNIHAVATGLSNAWGMVVADVDNNGVRDVAVGSGSQARVVTANTALTTFSITANLPKPTTFFPQNMNFADVDNDGMVDLFVCNDDAAGVFWKNVAGAYPAMTNFFSVNNPGTDNSGNYGSIWTDIDNDGDIDFYIAHCRQGTPAGDARRLDQLFINDGAGNFTLDAANARGLRNTAMTWTASFDDIDNDGDLDCILTETDKASELFLNNGNGYFTDATAGSGFVVDITPYQSKMEDLDNDGFVDIIISGDDSRIFHNNHDHTFTLVSGLFDNNAMLSFATGDLNHDGKIDLYSSYGSVYNNPTNTNDVLWLNSTNNGNHFVTFNLQGTVSNRDALGARVEIYGAWGKQIREVRAGESYGTTNSFQCHFGLGTATTIDSVVVRWPKGLVTHIANPAADQFITVIEGQCYSADNVISFNGPTALCAGQTVTMTAPAGYTYLWSTGATTQNITVSTTGEFNVKITAGSGCSSISKTVTILSQPDETPTVTVPASTVFCEGDSVLLQGSPATNYLWSNGATTQNIYAKDAGTYSLTIQGTCAAFTSSAITLAPIASHVATTVDASACEGSPTSLNLAATTTGTSYWYDAPAGGTLVNSGSSYTTPAITSTTTYYVESHDTLFGLSGHVGPVTNAIGAGSSYTGDQAQIFDVVKACILRSVTVYSDSVGVRVIQLRDNGGNVLQSASVNILSGTYTIPLNFNLTPGTNYRLGWLAGSKPRLYRNSAGASYPYTINNLISVTGNTASDPARWYAYYNWLVEEVPVTCSSTRTPVTATIHSTPTVSISANGATEFCDGGSVVLTAANASTYSWSNGGATSSVTANASANYTVTITDANGCTNSASQSVTEYPLPDNTVTSDIPTTICPGNTVNLSAPAGMIYSWSNNATSQSIAVSANGTFTVTVTDAHSCSAVSLPVTVSVSNNAISSITPSGATNLCEGGSVQLTASSGDSYLWSNGETTQTIDVNATGNFSVTVTTTGTCLAVSDTTHVVINLNPTVSLSGLNAQYLNTDAVVNLTGTPSGGTFSGTGINGTTFDPAAAGVGGPYTITYSYTDGNGCSASTSFDVTVQQNTTDIGSLKLEGISGVSIYPNPNSGSFAITFKTVGDVKADISLTNEIGQKIFEEKNVLVSNSFVKPLHMEQIAKGIYQLSITSGKQKSTYKITIQ